MPGVVAGAGAGVILMHSRGSILEIASYTSCRLRGDVVAGCCRELRGALELRRRGGHRAGRHRGRPGVRLLQDRRAESGAVRSACRRSRRWDGRFWLVLPASGFWAPSPGCRWRSATGPPRPPAPWPTSGEPGCSGCTTLPERAKRSGARPSAGSAGPERTRSESVRGRPTASPGVGWCCWCYLLTLAPTVTFWDAGEFIAAAKTLGIPHPPGTPLFVMIAHVWAMLLPIGEYAFRTNLLSAVLSARGSGLLLSGRPRVDARADYRRPETTRPRGSCVSAVALRRPCLAPSPSPIGRTRTRPRSTRSPRSPSPP